MKKYLSIICLIPLLLSCNLLSRQHQPEKTVQSDNQDIQGEYYFSADFDGSEIQYKQDQDDYLNVYGEGVWANDSGIIEGEYFSAFMQYQAVKNKAYFGFIVNFEKSSEPNLQEIFDAFSTGAWDFAVVDTVNQARIIKPGAYIDIVDQEGKLWSSTYINNNQDSKFKVLEIVDNEESLSRKTITVEFSCTLFDLQGNTKQITNGKARGMLFMVN
ncbi:MAG: hypothetical protein ACQESZ_09400 [Bacteroidota bacterium]